MRPVSNFLIMQLSNSRGGHGEESADDHRITFFQGTIIHFFTENRKKEKKRLDYFLK